MDPMEKQSLQKMPPHDDEAELAVLSSIMLDNPMLNAVIPISPPEMFYSGSSKKVLAAMQTMSERGEPIDLITLKAQLVTDGTLQDVGGETFLCRLADELPSGANAVYYAEIVREKHISRKMLHMSMELASRCYAEHDPSSELMNFAQDRMLEANAASSNGSFTKIGLLAKQTYERFQLWSQKKGGIIGIPSGFYDLDRMIGGFLPGKLIIVAGRPAMGKTSLSLNMARHIAMHLGIPTAFFSAEMPEDELSNRLVCTDALVSQQDIRENNLSQDDWDHLATATEVMSHAPLSIYDHVPLSAAQMVPLCKGLKLKENLGCVIVDYLQLMDSGDEYLDQKSNMTAKVSGISRRLKNLAKQVQVPVIVLSQLNRKLEERSEKRPMLSDLRDSGCVVGDTQVFLPAHGTTIAIRDLVGKHDIPILSLNTDTWKLEKTRMSRAFCTGEKQTFRLTTRLGRTIRATANHKFLTIEGWKRLDELSVKEHIAIPRKLPSPSEENTMSPAELSFLGHMIGDGCMLPTHALQYTTDEFDVAIEVVELAREVFGDSIDPRIQRERTWYQVYFPSTLPLSRNRRNPVAVWLEKLGLWGKRSHERYIPEDIFKQSIQGIRTFLRHLWSTDGCITMVRGKSPSPGISYATSSLQLAQGVQTLLLRCGINARLKRQPQGNKGRDQYNVIISGKSEAMRFIVDIGGIGERREVPIEEIKMFLSAKQENTNRDVIPLDVWKSLVVPSMQQHRITTRQLQAHIGTAYNGTAIYRHNLGRERARRVAIASQSEELCALASSDVYWDRIASIERSGVEPVYDMTVPGNHNFIAENILLHNSLEQDADIVIFVYRPEVYHENAQPGLTELIISKHRNGPTGTVFLNFQKEFTKFVNVETKHDANPFTSEDI